MAAVMYLVKGVPSGDMLQVCDPKEKDTKAVNDCARLSLSIVSVPRVGRTTQYDVELDEKWGWEAREFVRKAVIGKTIKFIKEGEVGERKREIGEVLYQKDGKVHNLAVELAKAGLCDIKDGAKNTDQMRNVADALMSAVQEQRGMYSTSKPRDDVTWRVKDEQVQMLGTEFRGKKVTGVVEAVLSGSLLRVCLVPQNIYLTVQMTGVICDRLDGSLPPNASPDDVKNQPLYAETSKAAKLFTERMLNHRDIEFIIDGTSGKRGDQDEALLATIVSGESVFQEVLLKNGFARIQEQALLKATSNKQRMVDAEKAAKERRAGRWANLRATQVVKGTTKPGAEEKAAPSKVDNFTGRLLHVQSPDTLIVLNDKTKEEVRVSLANVRGGGHTDNEPPSRDGANAATKSDSTNWFARVERDRGMATYKNFFMEGRNLLASRLVEKELRIDVEYMAEITANEDREKSPADQRAPDIRAQASVYYKNSSGQWKNIAIELIEEGFAVNLPARDGQRAKDYFEYSDAFMRAKEGKKGLHGNRTKGEHKVQEIVSGGASSPADEKKGRAMLTYLQRSGSGTAGVPKLRGFVEYVLGPARVKLHIPRENVLISLNIAGLATPSLPMPGQAEKPDYLAQEALNFSKLLLNQREVEVRVEFFGKGTFIGNIWVENRTTKAWDNAAQVLLREGFATMTGQNTASMVDPTAAEAVEREAKVAQKGIWGPDGSLPKRVQENLDRFERRTAGRVGFQIGTPGQRASAVITELLDSTTFYFQLEENKAQIKKVESALHALNLDPKPAPEDASKLPTGKLVAAKFTDGKWYRARVTKQMGAKASLQYVDFGNRQTVEVSKIRLFADDSLEKIPPLAAEGNLAFMHQLGETDIGADDASMAVEDFIDAGAITLAHEYTLGRKKFYTVRAGERPLQADLIKRGLGLVALDVQENKDLAKPVGILTKLEQQARSQKAGMWRDLRGDPRSYDE